MENLPRKLWHKCTQSKENLESDIYTGGGPTILSDWLITIYEMIKDLV